MEEVADDFGVQLPFVLGEELPAKGVSNHIILARKVSCSQGDTMLDRPIPETNCLCTKWAGTRTSLSVDIIHRANVVGENLY